GADGDEYRIHVVAPNFDLAIFATADSLSRYTMPVPLWNALTTSAAGAGASIELRRLSAGNGDGSARETGNIAEADLRGSIYYGAVDVGQSVKLDLTAGKRSAVFDAGPAAELGTPAPLNASTPRTPPWEDATADHKRCVACHSVSKDGTTIAAIFSRDE